MNDHADPRLDRACALAPPLAVALALLGSLWLEPVRVPLRTLSLSDLLAMSCLAFETVGFFAACYLGAATQARRVRSAAGSAAAGFMLAFAVQVAFAPIASALANLL